jgi:hypothetical protein
MAPVDVRAVDDTPLDEATVAAVHHATSDLGVCATSPELSEAGLRGGRVLLFYGEQSGHFWAWAEFESPTPLADEQLEFLKRETSSDWHDGVTSAFFEYLGQRLGLRVRAAWREPLTVSQLQGQGWRFAPWSELAQACWRGNLEAARAALDAGDNVNACPDGLPILHGAIIQGHAEVARLLIERGADVRVPDVLASRRDALWTCVTCAHPGNSLLPVARMLLEQGVDPLRGHPDSPLDVARRRNWDRMVGLLEEFATPPRGLRLHAGDRVSVRGPFAGMLGWVEQDVSTDAASSAKVRIHLFGRDVVIDVPSNELFPLGPSGQPRPPE